MELATMITWFEVCGSGRSVYYIPSLEKSVVSWALVGAVLVVPRDTVLDDVCHEHIPVPTAADGDVVRHNAAAG